MNNNHKQPIDPGKNAYFIQPGLMNKEKVATYAYLIFSFITISFFGIFALLPTFSTVSSLNKQYEDNKKVAEALETKLDALASLDKEYESLEKDLFYIYNAVPTSSEIPTFLRQIETIALENNVILESLSAGTVELYPLQDSESDMYSYTFSLEATGIQQNINSFINSIISFNRLVSIDRITTGETSSNRYKTSIGGKVYFSKEAI